MSLRVPVVSQESVRVVRDNLSQLAGRATFRHRALARVNPLDVALALPHDVYTLGLDDLVRGATLDDAQPVGRRFLVMAGDEAVASAEITGDGAGFQANEGPFVAATARAVARAEQDPATATGDYEVRVLRLPALYFMALWLKSDGGRPDLVIPMDPAPAPFSAGKSVDVREVVSELANLARRRLEFDDIADAGS